VYKFEERKNEEWWISKLNGRTFGRSPVPFCPHFVPSSAVGSVKLK